MPAVVVTGSASYANAEETPPPPVVLFSYQLSGTVRGADGEPVQGAIVSTRSVDREFWTLSPESGPDGAYASFFYPTGDTDPVGFTVRVAVGDEVFEFLPDELVFFQKLHSARLDIDLPPKGFPLARKSDATEDTSVINASQWLKQAGMSQSVSAARPKT